VRQAARAGGQRLRVPRRRARCDQVLESGGVLVDDRIDIEIEAEAVRQPAALTVSA